MYYIARTYAHFFTSILCVNFQFGSNEYILIVWHSSSLAAKLLRRVTRAKPDVYSWRARLVRRESALARPVMVP